MKHINIFSDHINESKKESDDLIVKTSTIPNSGNGLFAKRDFKKGEIIAYFTGKLIDNDKFDLLKKHFSGYPINHFGGTRGHYLIDLGDKTLDTYDSDCLAKYANDIEGPAKTNKQNNSTIFSSKKRKSAYICATHNIKAGDEIFVSYGKEYWDNIGNDF
jgi:hypothetical protein